MKWLNKTAKLFIRVFDRIMLPLPNYPVGVFWDNSSRKPKISDETSDNK
jgi:hypothetical protein